MERKSRKRRTLRYLAAAGFTLLGAAGGYLYYRLVGCPTGTCLIASNPVLSTVYCGIIGLLLGTSLLPLKKEEQSKKEDPHA